MKSYKQMIIGFAIGALLFGAAPVLAENVEVLFNSIKVTVNGQSIAADNILYNGTTYVPLRTISEILDKDVIYNEATRTAEITDKGRAATPTIPEPVPTQGETVSQQNAVKSAKSYLEFAPFSRQRLIKQLEYEGFSTEDATYGVEHSGADWNAQAVKSAEAYLKFSSFSRQRLINQLEYEGYTHEQAVYGVDATGL